MISKISKATLFIGCAALAPVAAIGCVSTRAYEAKMEELDDARRVAATIDREHRKKIGALERALAAEKHAREVLKSEAVGLVADLELAKRDLQASYDNSTALVGELKKRLERTGQNVDRLVSEQGTLASALDDAKRRLDEVRRQKLAAEARALAFRALAAKLHGMIDAGALQVTVRDGRMILVLPTDVLFDSGRAEVRDEAKIMLAEIAKGLASIPDRRFEVAGHTDRVPIHTRQFPSNWELSTQRAVEVTKVLIAGGVAPERLSAAGYGEYDPVSLDEADEGRAKNRRIEITVLPKIEELPLLDDLG